MDLCSRRVIGWATATTLEPTLVLSALERAVAVRQPAPGVMVHSDRGIQYAGTPYRNALARHGLIASMSRRANCYDNAAMEPFWSTLKLEHLFAIASSTRPTPTARSSTTSKASITPAASTRPWIIARRSTSNLSATNHIKSAQPGVRKIGANPGGFCPQHADWDRDNPRSSDTCTSLTKHFTQRQFNRLGPELIARTT